MERRDSDKHDCTSKSTKDMFCHNYAQVSQSHDSITGEYPDSHVSDTRCNQPPDKSPHPQSHRTEGGTPFPGIVTETDFKGKVDEDGEGEVFLGEAFVEELEVCDGVVCLEADFGDEVDNTEGLDVWRWVEFIVRPRECLMERWRLTFQFHNLPHCLVNLYQSFLGAVLLFLLQNCKAYGDDEVCPAPECEVSREGHEAFWSRRCAEVSVCKVRGVEC